MLDGERLEIPAHFPGLLEQGAQIGAFHLVLAAHLLYEQFGVAFDSQGANAVGLRVVERCNQAVILRYVIGALADIFLEPGDDKARWIPHDNAIRCRAGIAARRSVNIRRVGWAAGGRGGRGALE